MLERQAPRARLDVPVPEAALSLGRSYLFVQGPPGSGKTWQGAKAAVALMKAGRRVGVTSLSHKAIGKLLAEIEREARKQGFRFRGRKKSSGDDDSRFEGDFIDSSDHWQDLLDPELQLVAGTSWLFVYPQFEGFLDTLIVDEAGQVALADVVAVGHAARNLVLLGDPNQLRRSRRARCPTRRSAVGAPAPARGRAHGAARARIFLAETAAAAGADGVYLGRVLRGVARVRPALRELHGRRRRRPRLPRSRTSRTASSRGRRRTRSLGRSALSSTAYTDEHGRTRLLTEEDVLVVTPYNAQTLRTRVPAGVRVGTVDKFQGQEAPVVIVSLASSSGEEAPRGIAFVFNRNRINVATSRRSAASSSSARRACWRRTARRSRTCSS